MKILGLSVVICSAVVMSGCGTERGSSLETVSMTTTETSVAAKVVGTTTVSVAKAAAAPVPGPDVAAPAPAPVDILEGARKPCGTLAADAPKFVDPAVKEER